MMWTTRAARYNNKNLLQRMLLQTMSFSSLVVLLLLALISTTRTVSASTPSFENTTIVTLNNMHIVASHFTQVQGTILYDSGYVDLESIMVSVSPGSGTQGGVDPSTIPAFTFLDIAVTQVPEACLNASMTTESKYDVCDWAKNLGISIPGSTTGGSGSGSSSSITKDSPYTNVAPSDTSKGGSVSTYWCCTKAAMAAGACNQTQYGRLLINETLFHGSRGSMQIPMGGDDNENKWEAPLPMEASGYGFNKAGVYALILANCHEMAPDVILNGDTEWTSFNAKEEAKEEVPFYTILGIGYLVLMSWFAYLMKQNKASRIPLEEWIFGCIVLGFFEMLFRTMDYYVWGNSGSNLPILSLIAMIVSAAKHSFGRCLLLMVGMGWGVVRASLARHTSMGIITIGAVYLIASALFDIYFTVVYEMETSSSGTDDDTISPMPSIFQVCFWLSFYIDIVFLVWIPSAMCQTMNYLKTTNQLRKLERYRILLRIMMVAVVLTIITIILVFTETFGLSFMEIGQGNELNFFFILLFVAVVWRPNPSARDYAYAMELGSGEHDGGATDLELVADSQDDEPPPEQAPPRRGGGRSYNGAAAATPPVGAPTIDRAEPA